MFPNILLPALLLLQTSIASANPLPKPTPTTPTLWLVSDSTCFSYNPATTPLQGFGYFLPEYFTLNVTNRARGGRSTRSFINEGLWAELMGYLKPKDLVMIEMGHNDNGTPGTGSDVGKDRAVLPGIGPETVEVIDKNNATETVYTFGYYLRNMVTEVRAHGAIPILSGMVPVMAWSSGDAVNSTLRTNWPFTEYARQIADEMQTGWINHTEYSVQRFQALGRNASLAMYPLDNTHTDADGARLNAETFVTGVKCGKTRVVKDLEKYLNKAGKAVKWKC